MMLAVVGIALLPLAWRGPSCGHDFDFHLESWLEIVRQWHQGVLYPHWAASPNFGAGEPRFVFYPPASWMLGALLGAVLPWTWTPLAFTLIALVLLAACFFRMAREWMPLDDAALAACLYVVNPYVLFVAYERTAYAELLAGAWLPLLVLYAMRAKPSAMRLALVVCLLWLTNAPAAVMGCYALVVLVGVTALMERNWRLIARSAVAVPLGLGMSAFYLVPAIYEQKWVEIRRAIAEGMRVEDSFLFEHTGEAFHDQVLHSASWIAVAMLAITLASWLLSLRVKSAKWRIPFAALAVAIAVLLTHVSDPAWRYIPELRFLQFPWRWLLVLGIVMAAFAGLAMRGTASSRRRILWRTSAVFVMAASLSALTWTQFWQPCDDEDNVTAQRASFASDEGFEGTDEYTVTPADNGDIQRDMPEIRLVTRPDGDEADSSVKENPEWDGKSPDLQPSQVQIRRWNVEHMTAAVRTKASGFLVLRVTDYPAWRVLLNGGEVHNPPRRDDGLITIPVAAGDSLVDVRYRATPDMWAGRIVSVLALVIWIGLYLLEVRKRHPETVSWSECKPKFQ
ncbi:hypothetical protein [Silvibacterium acidisoli]|uniref:hypothetical protein n=1 Tax=Acidobacteriaceae bacterium ZG23-2 TaxID=2883246 RepID=UPI00406C28F5